MLVGYLIVLQSNQNSPRYANPQTELTRDRDDFIYGTIKEIKGFLGEDLGLSREETKNSSELRNHSSEVSLHSSELLFPGSVGNFRLFRGASRFPREKLQSAEMPASL